jgi:hypothetical protein
MQTPIHDVLPVPVGKIRDSRCFLFFHFLECGAFPPLLFFVFLSRSKKRNNKSGGKAPFPVGKIRDSHRFLFFAFCLDPLLRFYFDRPSR